MEKTMMQAIEDAKNVQPFAKVEGVDVVTFEDYNDLVTRDHQFNALPGTVSVDKQGFPTGTPTPYLAYNPDQLFRNRYRKVRDTLQIVTDFRAISEQSTGRVYAAQIPAFVVVRDKDGELKYDKTILVSDNEFLKDFTNSLSNDSMAVILPLLSLGGNEPTKDSIPI